MKQFFVMTMLAVLLAGCGGTAASVPSIPSIQPMSVATNSVPQGVLASGAQLIVGQAITLYTQSHARYGLSLQTSGNLVLSEGESNPFNPSIPLWSTNTTTGHTLRMNVDGNLELCDAKDRIVWASGTLGYRGAFLQIQNNSDLVIMYKSTPIWSANAVVGYDLAPSANLVSFPNTKQINGQSWISSLNGLHGLSISNGNLLLESAPVSGTVWTTVWSTKTNSGSTLRMQSDGNLVLYNTANVALWSSGTWGRYGDFLSLQNDGTMTISLCRSHGAGYTNTTGASGCSIGNTYPIWTKKA